MACSTIAQMAAEKPLAKNEVCIEVSWDSYQLFCDAEIKAAIRRSMYMRVTQAHCLDPARWVMNIAVSPTMRDYVKLHEPLWVDISSLPAELKDEQRRVAALAEVVGGSL